MHLVNRPDQDTGRGGLQTASRGEEPARQTIQEKVNRDTGYLCLVCATVFSFQQFSERRCLFCAICGSTLVEESCVSYSRTAEMCQDKARSQYTKMLRRHHAKLRQIMPPPSLPGALPPVLICQGDRDQVQVDQVQVEDLTVGQKRLAPTSMAVSFKVRRDISAPVNCKRKIMLSRHTKSFVHSKFCDVCGHSQTEVNCSKCPATFHKRCLCLQPAMPVPPRFTCHGCLNEERRGKRVPLPQIQDASQERSVVPRKMPETPMQCSSCGYHEIESLFCEDCKRWFCFACMCVSLDTLPSDAWNCPECIGLVAYDQMLMDKIAASREKMSAGGAVPAQVEDGFSQLVFDLFCGCAWDEWARNIGTLVAHAKRQLDNGVIPVVMPFHSLHYARPGVDMDKGTMRRISEAYARDTKERALKSIRQRPGEDGPESAPLRMWRPERVSEPAARLRIGYISSDFVNHPTADLIQSALLSHDTARFEVFCYSITKDDKSDYRKTLSQRMEHFRTFSRRDTDRRCAEAIADDGIHILVNLNGHTANDRNGISALRPAPVQVVYLAYPGTMGADYIDYNVADPTVCPPEHRQHYSERLLQMPFCYQTNSFRMLYSAVHDPRGLPTREEHQLPEAGFVFCNFCRLGRITPELFDVWISILKRVPASVIWLYKHPKTAVLRLQEQARRRGLDAARFVFGPPCSPKTEHLKRVTLADLCLDTLVYNGHTTGSDMLWAGVPMVTMRGDNWPSLVAACLAKAVEMPEMVVEDLAGYEELAVALATQPDMMAAWKAKLREKRLVAPLFDHVRWVRTFERGLETVWRMHAEGRTEPRDILVEDVGPRHAPPHPAPRAPRPAKRPRRPASPPAEDAAPSPGPAEARAAAERAEEGGAARERVEAGVRLAVRRMPAPARGAGVGPTPHTAEEAAEAEPGGAAGGPRRPAGSGEGAREERDGAWEGGARAGRTAAAGRESAGQQEGVEAGGRAARGATRSIVLPPAGIADGAAESRRGPRGSRDAAQDLRQSGGGAGPPGGGEGDSAGPAFAQVAAAASTAAAAAEWRGVGRAAGQPPSLWWARGGSAEGGARASADGDAVSAAGGGGGGGGGGGEDEAEARRRGPAQRGWAGAGAAAGGPPQLPRPGPPGESHAGGGAAGDMWPGGRREGPGGPGPQPHPAAPLPAALPHPGVRVPRAAPHPAASASAQAAGTADAPAQRAAAAAALEARSAGGAESARGPAVAGRAGGVAGGEQQRPATQARPPQGQQSMPARPLPTAVRTLPQPAVCAEGGDGLPAERAPNSYAASSCRASASTAPPNSYPAQGYPPNQLQHHHVLLLAPQAPHSHPYQRLPAPAPGGGVTPGRPPYPQLQPHHARPNFARPPAPAGKLARPASAGRPAARRSEVPSPAERRRAAGRDMGPPPVFEPPGAMLPRRSRPVDMCQDEPPPQQQPPPPPAVNNWHPSQPGGGPAADALQQPRYAEWTAGRYPDSALRPRTAPDGGAGGECEAGAEGGYPRAVPAGPPAAAWQTASAVGLLAPPPMLPPVCATQPLPLAQRTHHDLQQRAYLPAPPVLPAQPAWGVRGSPATDMPPASDAGLVDPPSAAWGAAAAAERRQPDGGDGVGGVGGVSGGDGGAGGDGGMSGVVGLQDDVCSVEVLKDSVSRMVKERCNAQYQAHAQRNSATDAVRLHLKVVFRRGLQRAREWAMSKAPNGLCMRDQRRFERRYWRQVEAIVSDSSRDLQPTFHWLQNFQGPATPLSTGNGMSSESP